MIIIIASNKYGKSQSLEKIDSANFTGVLAFQKTDSVLGLCAKRINGQLVNCSFVLLSGNNELYEIQYDTETILRSVNISHLGKKLFITSLGKGVRENEFNLSLVTAEGNTRSLIWWEAFSGDTIQQYIYSMSIDQQGRLLLCGGAEISDSGFVNTFSGDIMILEVDTQNQQVQAHHYSDTNTGYIGIDMAVNEDSSYFVLYQGYDSNTIKRAGILHLGNDFEELETLEMDSFIIQGNAVSAGPNSLYSGSILNGDNHLYVNLNVVQYEYQPSFKTYLTDQVWVLNKQTFEIESIWTSDLSESNVFAAEHSLAKHDSVILHGYITKETSTQSPSKTYKGDSNRFILVGLGLLGNEIWKKEFHPFGTGHYRLSSIDSIENGFVVSGSFYSIEKDLLHPFFMLLDAKGVLLSAQTLVSKPQLEIFPNPSAGLFQFSESLTGIVRLFDLNGKLIFESFMNRESHLDVSDLYSGVYLIKFEGDCSFVKRVVISK